MSLPLSIPVACHFKPMFSSLPAFVLAELSSSNMSFAPFCMAFSQLAPCEAALFSLAFVFVWYKKRWKLHILSFGGCSWRYPCWASHSHSHPQPPPLILLFAIIFSILLFLLSILWGNTRDLFLDLARLFVRKKFFLAALYSVIDSSNTLHSWQSSHLSSSCLSLLSFAQYTDIIFAMYNVVL